jgi:hypothetical protein
VVPGTSGFGVSASIRVACVQLAHRDWHKEMAPGTDVVRGRTPRHYTELARVDRDAGDRRP